MAGMVFGECHPTIRLENISICLPNNRDGCNEFFPRAHPCPIHTTCSSRESYVLSGTTRTSRETWLTIVTTGSTGTIGKGDTFKLTNMECLVAKLHLIKEWTYASHTSRTTGETASH